MSPPAQRPPWTVALICGASGTGKTTVAAALAARHGVPLAQADDMVTVAQALTTAGQEPALHYWDTHPQARAWSPDRIVRLHLRVADRMAHAFRAVIADHVASDAPVVLEGDYLLPALASGLKGVRVVVLDEPDEDQIVASYLMREPDAGPQRVRARVSVLLGQQLVLRAEEIQAPVVPARPWIDGADRVGAALWTGGPGAQDA